MLIGTRLCHCRQQAILQKGQKLRPPKGRSEMWTQIILVRGEPSRNCPIPTSPTEVDLGFVEVGFRELKGWLEQSLCCSCTHAQFSFFFSKKEVESNLLLPVYQMSLRVFSIHPFNNWPANSKRDFKFSKPETFKIIRCLSSRKCLPLTLVVSEQTFWLMLISLHQW